MVKLRSLAASVLLIAPLTFAQGSGMGRAFGPGSFASMRRPVTNAPYSATFTATATEKLQDGTVLTHTTTRVVSRDSLGRTREEVTLPAHGDDAKPRTMIVIIDPVAKTVTRLNAEKKVAIVHSMPEGYGRFHGDHGPAGPPDTPPPPPSSAAASSPDAHSTRGDRKNEQVADLGSKTISGVLATGERVTRTVPANAIGNATPIISTHEHWFSPDLKIEVARTDVDPFRGTNTLTVSGLTKAEPDASLFRVPTGYTTEAASQRAFGRRAHKGELATPPAPPAGM